MKSPTKTLFERVQKSKKCKKCAWCIEKHIANYKYYLCTRRTEKLFTFDWTIQKCKHYHRRETICEDEPHAEKTETSEELR